MRLLDLRFRLERMERGLNRNKMGQDRSNRDSRRSVRDGGRTLPTVLSSNSRNRLLQAANKPRDYLPSLRTPSPPVKQVQSLITIYAGCASWSHHCEYRAGQG